MIFPIKPIVIAPHAATGCVIQEGAGIVSQGKNGVEDRRYYAADCERRLLTITIMPATYLASHATPYRQLDSGQDLEATRAKCFGQCQIGLAVVPDFKVRHAQLYEAEVHGLASRARWGGWIARHRWFLGDGIA